MAGGGEDSGEAFSFAEFVIPDYFSRTVVERANRGICPKDGVAPTPALGLGCDSVVVNAEEAACIHVEKICLGIEAGRHPIGCAVGAGLDKRTIGARSRLRFSDRPAF